MIYSADHDRTFADLRAEEVLRVIGLWQDLYADLAPRYASVMTWETSGAIIGQTQRHPHGQTYAVAIVPPLLAREMESVSWPIKMGMAACSATFWRRRTTALARWCLAITGWPSCHPMRATHWRYTSTRAAMSARLASGRAGAEMRELAALLPRLIQVYNQVFAGPMPYMLAVHQLADERFHLHIELLPVGRAPGKLKLAASSEMAWGFWLNDALPEAAAAELRALYAALANTIE